MEFIKHLHENNLNVLEEYQLVIKENYHCCKVPFVTFHMTEIIGMPKVGFTIEEHQ